MRKIILMIGVLVFALALVVHAEQTPQEQLNQLVADLQKNPDDFALREKIIKLVQTMKPTPEISEEAKRYMSRGIAAMKDAKSEDDFRDAVKEFEKASLATPWFANAYYNLGIAQYKAGIYADAIKILELYLLAASDARDAESVKGLIYEIEYRQEKAAKENSLEVQVAKKKAEWEKFLKSLDGGRWRESNPDTNYCETGFREVRGDKIIDTWYVERTRAEFCVGERIAGTRMGDMSATTIEGREFFWPGTRLQITISEDGETITEKYSDGRIKVFRRVR